MAKITEKQLQEKREHHNSVDRLCRMKSWEIFQAFEKKYSANIGISSYE
jgi:hypothetical protein